MHSKWRPHPWHGLTPGRDAPSIVNVYVEITPFDVVKYEIDKVSGYLRVDRAQRTSSLPPALYGFVPRTLAGPSVAKLTPDCALGDGDPLDICVLSDRPITRAEVLLEARVVGGIPTVDGGEADDKLVGILKGDLVLGDIVDLAAIPRALLDRIVHYFATYKATPVGGGPRVGEPYGRERAEAVVLAGMADYAEAFGPASE